MSQEKRSRMRVPIKFDVTVSTEGRDIKVKSWDFSLRGMKCTSDPALKHDTPCEVTIVLNPEISIIINGTILRTTEESTAIYFANMKEESFYHLKSLLQYNTNEPEKIEDELANPSKKPS